MTLVLYLSLVLIFLFSFAYVIPNRYVEFDNKNEYANANGTIEFGASIIGAAISYSLIITPYSNLVNDMGSVRSLVQ